MMQQQLFFTRDAQNGASAREEKYSPLQDRFIIERKKSRGRF